MKLDISKNEKANKILKYGEKIKPLHDSVLKTHSNETPVVINHNMKVFRIFLNSVMNNYQFGIMVQWL